MRRQHLHYYLFLLWTNETEAKLFGSYGIGRVYRFHRDVFRKELFSRHAQACWRRRSCRGCWGLWAQVTLKGWISLAESWMLKSASKYWEKTRSHYSIKKRRVPIWERYFKIISLRRVSIECHNNDGIMNAEDYISHFHESFPPPNRSRYLLGRYD